MDAVISHMASFGGFYIILSGYALMKLGARRHFRRCGWRGPTPSVFSRRFSELDFNREEKTAYEFGMGLIALGALVQVLIALN